MPKPKRGGAKAAARKARQKTQKPLTRKAAALQKQLSEAQGVRGSNWKPEIGDSTYGTVLSLERRSSQFRDDQVTMVLGTDEGARTVFCNWSLTQALLGQGVTIGDYIGLERKEDVKMPRGRPMHSFAAVRDGGLGKTPAKCLTEEEKPRRKVKKKRKKVKRRNR